MVIVLNFPPCECPRSHRSMDLLRNLRLCDRLWIRSRTIQVHPVRPSWFLSQSILANLPAVYYPQHFSLGNHVRHHQSQSYHRLGFARPIIGISVFQNYILNGVFWTLGIELQFYLLAPILAWPLARQGRNYFFAWIALYSLMVYWNQFASSQPDWSFDGWNIISNLPHFFIGIIAYRLVYSVKPNQILAISSLAVACGVLGYTNWLYQKGSYWSVRGILLVDLTIFLFIIAHACCQRKEASKILSI